MRFVQSVYNSAGKLPLRFLLSSHLIGVIQAFQTPQGYFMNRYNHSFSR